MGQKKVDSFFVALVGKGGLGAVGTGKLSFSLWILLVVTPNLHQNNLRILYINP